MNLFLLLWAVYSVTLLKVETVSVANYIHNVATLGLSATVISFVLAYLVAVRKNENKFLWWLLNSYLVPMLTPSKKLDFLKSNIPKFIIYSLFFGTLFLTSSKIL